MLLKIPWRTFLKIVDDSNSTPVCYQATHQMAPNEASTSRNDVSHGCTHPVGVIARARFAISVVARLAASLRPCSHQLR